MKITFFSNYINHHQIPFCDEMYKLLGDNFCFVQTQRISEDRIKMGWGSNDQYSYVLKSYQDKDSYQRALDLSINSEVVILGAAPRFFLEKRSNKLTFIQSERIFKKGITACFNLSFLQSIFKRYTLNRFYSNYYLLCSSAYAPYDFDRIFAFPERMLKWGYYPALTTYDTEALLKKKENTPIKILWVGRLIDWKHAEYAIYTARFLRDSDVCFELDVIGVGEEEANLLKLRSQFNLTNEVVFLGSMPPERVRNYMEKANIFIFTSDFQEGWGAVLNEAMNSACAVVVSHAIGAAPYLIKDGENGFLFENGNIQSLSQKVKMLIDHQELRKKVGLRAYETIKNQWNSKVAAQRIIEFSDAIIARNHQKFYQEGICSVAPVILNNWYK